MRNNSLKVVLVLATVCYTLAINSFNEKSVPIVKEIQDIDTIQVIAESDSLFVKGKYLYNKKGYKAAIDYFLKSDSVINAHYGTDCPYYGYGEKWASSCYHKLGMDSIAIEYSIYYDKEPIDKLLTHSSDSIIWLALNLIDLGQTKNAADKLYKAAVLEKQVLGLNSYWYANTLSVCSGLYSEAGNFEKAIKLGKEAVEIYKTTFGTNHPNYASCLNNLAACYADNGDDFTAIHLYLEALDVKKRLRGTWQPDYADDLSNLAESYSFIGNYSEALIYGIEAMNIRKSVFGTEHSDYAISLICLSEYYSALGNYSEALRLGTEALEIWKQVLGSTHPYYATALHYLATYYFALGNYVKALQMGTQAMELRREVLGTEDPHYATSFGNLALYNSYLGNYEEAIRIGKESLELDKRIFGTEHPNYLMSLTQLSSFYQDLGNYEKAYSYLKQYLDLSQSYILKRFVESTSNLREYLWISKYVSHYISVLPSIVEKYQNEESISDLYDKACLFAKGLLLNTDIEMRNFILGRGDSLLNTKYNKIVSNIKIYNKLIETPIAKRYVNADSLNNVIQRQGMELAKDSKAYGEYTHDLVIKWKDVQRGLDDNDIAIEFLNFPIYKTDSIVYIALTLKKDYEYPHMVTLFEERQLKSISEDGYYTQPEVSDLVWKPLEQELVGVRNVYFAPSGELHRIGIEYLPINKMERICDAYTLHRLSSTRQLAVIQDEIYGKTTILYGGINYDEKSSITQTNFVPVDESVLRSFFSRANVDSLSLRSSFDYLEGTKRETDMIAEGMRLHSVPYIYYSGIDGSEESFKQLNGTKPKTIHIATHGFYFMESEAEKTRSHRPEMTFMTERMQKTGRLIGDKSMTRSGLLLSGCNRAFRHEQIPETEEDGILTAQEISMLDLRGLDLVVLSACQTGLGEVISGEGVFGLQRGFKKAGAKTILMSLHKVDDKATQILMVEFYKNLMRGKSKHQSLKDAQKYLREVDNGKYDDPKYWAAFIMLDGLD